MKTSLLMACIALTICIPAIAGSPRAVSDRDVLELAKGEGLATVWEKEIDYGGDEDTDFIVFLYETPSDINPGFCSSREIGLGVKVTKGKNKIVHRQGSGQLALQECNGVSLDDFRSVEGRNKNLSMPVVANLLRDGLPLVGGSPNRITYSDDKLKPYFNEASKADLVEIYVESDDEVKARFSVRAMAPSLLEVTLKRNEDRSVDLRVALDGSPDPHWK